MARFFNFTINRSGSLKDRSKSQFEQWADSYDRSWLNHFLFRPSYIAMMEEIAAWHAAHPGRFRVLDIGCGTGTLAGLLARSSWPVETVGLDFAAAMCVQADQKARLTGSNGRARFVNADSEHLPFSDESFDFVSCSNSFHHYPHQQAAVSDMRRMLKPGGRLMIIDGFRDSVVGWFVFDVVIDHIEKEVHHASWTTVHEYFVKAGFDGIRRRKFNFLFPALATIGDR